MQVFILFLLSWVYLATASAWHSNHSDNRETGCQLLMQPTPTGSIYLDPTSSTSRSAQEEGGPSCLVNDAIMQWASRIWESTMEWWGTAHTENAKLCILQIIDLVHRDTNGANPAQAVVGTCHCGAFFGDKMNSPGLTRGVLTNLLENLDILGIPKAGYVAEGSIGTHRDERFGIAIHCRNEQWVADKLAQYSATGFSKSHGAQWYGAIPGPSAY